MLCSLVSIIPYSSDDSSFTAVTLRDMAWLPQAEANSFRLRISKHSLGRREGRGILSGKDPESGQRPR